MEILGLSFGVIGLVVSVLIGVLVMAALVENNRPIVSAVALVVWGFVLYFLGFNVIEWVSAHTKTTFIIVAVYFAFMPVWMYVKWIFYAMKMKQALKDFRERPVLGTDGQIRSGTYVPEGSSSSSESPEDYWKRTHNYPPKVAEHKGDFMTWGIYWPFSLLATLVDEPVRRFFNMIFNGMKGALQKASDRITAEDKTPAE